MDTGHAWLADLAGDDRGVAGRAAACGQDPLRHGHPVEVVGRRLDPHEHDALALADPVDRGVRIEHGTADGRARRGVEALGDPGRTLARRRIELVTQELIHVSGLDPPERLFLGDDALSDEVSGDPDGRRPGPLAGPGLEHVQGAVLDRELDVLHLLVVRLELLADAHQLVVDLGHLRRAAG